jgi:cupin 2 domain-containing protein
MTTIVDNIFANLPAHLSNELFEILLENKNIKIERIISKGHCSPDDFWYDQEQNEWVMVLQGKASLLFENEEKPVLLSQVDYLNVPEHKKHRINRTDPNQKTIWLTVYY